MEPLQRLTRRQVDALQVIQREESAARGAPLKLVARKLGIAPPSALGHVEALEKLGLISRHAGKSRLTPPGEQCLIEYLRHHRVAERLFGRLGLSPDDTCAAAREVDLALSHRTVEQLCRAEGHPAECPHGAPIPPCGSPRSGR